MPLDPLSYSGSAEILRCGRQDRVDSFSPRRSAIGFVFALILPVLGVAGQEKHAPAPTPQSKPQRIPFSHKLHSQFIPECSDCHTIAADETTDPEVSYPPESKCMQCHETVAKDKLSIKKLAEYYEERKPIPWVQVYELPEFVFFTHKVHYIKAKIDCGACHGPVAQRDVITREKSISMVACLDCHRAKGAPVKCNTCHNPNP